MLSFKELKTKLSEISKDYTRYFTENFYNTYLKENEISLKHFAQHGEWLVLEQTYNSDFYLKNSCAWCTMLELLNESRNRWRVDFFKTDSYCNELVRREYINYDTKEQAQLWANGYIITCNEEPLTAEILLVA